MTLRPITWRDRIAAAWRRLGGLAGVVEKLVLLVAVFIFAFLLVVALSSCDQRPAPVGPPIASQPILVDPPRPGESSEAATLRQLRGQLANVHGQESALLASIADSEAAANRAHREAMVAPIRVSLIWAAWLGGLGMLAGAALAVASVVWAMAIGWKGGATIAAMGAVVLGGALALLFALDWAVAHPLILAAVFFGLVALVVIGYAVLRHHAKSMVGASAELAQAGHEALSTLEALGHSKAANSIRNAAAKRQDAVRGLRDGVRKIRDQLGHRRPAAP